MSPSSRAHSSKVPAASHTLRILSLLTSIDVPISAARIQAELDLPRSTVYHLLTVMIEAGFVVRLPEEKTYGLGVAAYSMANAYTSQQPLVRVGARHARALTSGVHGSAHMAKLAGSDVLYILEERALHAPSLVTDVGVRLPAVETASGLCMLAFLAEKQVRAALGDDAMDRQFRAECLQIRGRGWAEEDGIVTAGQRTVAAPIFDHVGRPTASLAVTFPSGSLTPEQLGELCQEIMNRASSIAGTVYGSRAGNHLQSLIYQTGRIE
ncbi:IclR family transcriptional regulator [Corynebacterium epidermidicanis]|uniref:Transcriptional regulator, IclR family n=1 Tax=Corynebacterium epidermidicanis TaxID=1050174 RepID=A0A0G3GXY1_9CORY|nr:IclR family transcriptional regulator [Corynebacterium epidermidicanis]AKK03672.1 transcriptional regulator, IclR family [Corynebacterium epidermidicanis]